MTPSHDPASGDKYRCHQGQPCEDVLAPLRAVERARDLLADEDELDTDHVRTTLALLRQQAAWRALGHDYGQGTP